MASSIHTIDAYISAFDGVRKERMIALRSLIHSCHPVLSSFLAQNAVFGG